MSMRVLRHLEMKYLFVSGRNYSDSMDRIITSCLSHRFEREFGIRWPESWWPFEGTLKSVSWAGQSRIFAYGG